MDILTRVKDILSKSGLSVRAFAINCGMAQKTFDNQIKGLRGMSLETVMSILYSYPEISAEWLLRGEGEMEKQEIATEEVKRIAKLNNVVESLQEVIDNKNAAISSLNERIKQLENQLKSK